MLDRSAERGHFTMLHEHTIFNKEYIMEYFTDDTFFVASVREPLARIRSWLGHRKTNGFYQKRHGKISANRSAKIIAISHW